MLRTKNRSVAEFFVSRDATSAVEFAIILPVLLIVMLGGIQLVTYINAVRKVGHIAASVGEMISETAPPQGSTTGTSTPADIHFAYDSTLVLFPYIMTDAVRQGVAWWQDIEIDFASVKFTQISSSCTNQSDLSACYTAQVAWTTTLGSNPRACLPLLTPASNTAPPSKTTLPSGIFGPGTLIVIDVHFTFRPSFGSTFIPSVQINRSVYMKPRYANYIAMDFSSGDSIVLECPGF